MTSGRLEQQLRFLLEADRLKHVERATLVADGRRVENSAEHSWHLALMAIVLRDCAPEDVDLGRTLELLVVHDLVEIDAGDTVVYDVAAVATQREREDRAAERLFALLPGDQADHLRALRDEFERGESAEARYARALDAFQPTWLHWDEHARPPAEQLDAATVLARKQPALEAFPALWQRLRTIVDAAARRGLLRS